MLIIVFFLPKAEHASSMGCVGGGGEGGGGGGGGQQVFCLVAKWRRRGGQ